MTPNELNDAIEVSQSYAGALIGGKPQDSAVFADKFSAGIKTTLNKTEPRAAAAIGKQRDSRRIVGAFVAFVQHENVDADAATRRRSSLKLQAMIFVQIQFCFWCDPTATFRPRFDPSLVAHIRNVKSFTQRPCSINAALTSL